MIDLPPGFDGHPRWEGSDDACVLCALWDEPAWFWHADVPRPGSFQEQAAQFREAVRLAGLEFLAALDRAWSRILR